MAEVLDFHRAVLYLCSTNYVTPANISPCTGSSTKNQCSRKSFCKAPLKEQPKACISQHEWQRYLPVLTETAIIVGMRLVVAPTGFSPLPLMDCQLGGSKQNRYLSIKLGSRGAKNRILEADFVADQ